MAQHLEQTDKGKADEAEPNDTTNEISGWLRKHNLCGKNDIVLNTFLEENISVSQLFELADHITDLNDFLDAILERKYRILISSKIKKLKKAQNQQNIAVQQPQVIRIFISEQEERSLNKLNAYKAQIDELDQQLSEINTNVMSKVRACEHAMQSSFEDLLKRIESKRNEMKLKLKVYQIRAKSAVEIKTKKINAEKAIINNALQKCSSLQQNVNVNRNEQKHKIIEITNDILNNQLSNAMLIDISNIQINFAFKSLIGSSHFLSDLCSLSYTTLPDYVPNDNPLLLSLNADDEKLADEEHSVYTLFKQAVQNGTKINIVFQRKYYMFLFIVIYNNKYLFGGSNDTNISQYIRMVVDKDLQHEITEDSRQRLSNLMINILTNNFSQSIFKLTSNSKMKDILIARLCLHLLFAVLSVPSNPFSKLFHHPESIHKDYLPGMPEEQSYKLLKVMAGHGIWLCPNNHIYFVGNCTATNGTGNCYSCHAPIGNKIGVRSHIAANKNKRVGKIDKNGKIVPDNPYSGATEGIAPYDFKSLQPKGYVLVEGGNMDAAVRDLDEISAVVVRLMFNAVLLAHVSEKTKYAAQSLMQNIESDIAIKMLQTAVNNGIKKFADNWKIYEISFEDAIYLLHQIVDNFYKQFPNKYKRGVETKGLEERRSFENWLSEKCIKPVIENVYISLPDIKNKINYVVTNKNKKAIDEKKEEKERDGVGPIRIYVKNLLGECLGIDVMPIDTIENLKLKLQERIGIEPSQIRLIYRGRRLDDERTVEDYMIKHGSVLMWIRRLRGS